MMRALHPEGVPPQPGASQQSRHPGPRAPGTLALSQKFPEMLIFRNKSCCCGGRFLEQTCLRPLAWDQRLHTCVPARVAGVETKVFILVLGPR